MSNRPATSGPSISQAVLAYETHTAELKAELANAICRKERRQIEADLRVAQAALASLRKTMADLRAAQPEPASLSSG